MAGIQLGKAYLVVEPSTRGLAPKLADAWKAAQKDVAKAGVKAGEAYADSATQAINRNGLDDALAKQFNNINKDARTEGTALGRTYTTEATKALARNGFDDAMQRQFDTILRDARSEGAQAGQAYTNEASRAANRNGGLLTSIRDMFRNGSTTAANEGTASGRSYVDQATTAINRSGGGLTTSVDRLFSSVGDRVVNSASRTGAAYSDGLSRSLTAGGRDLEDIGTEQGNTYADAVAAVLAGRAVGITAGISHGASTQAASAAGGVLGTALAAGVGAGMTSGPAMKNLNDSFTDYSTSAKQVMQKVFESSDFIKITPKPGLNPLRYPVAVEAEMTSWKWDPTFLKKAMKNPKAFKELSDRIGEALGPRVAAQIDKDTATLLTKLKDAGRKISDSIRGMFNVKTQNKLFPNGKIFPDRVHRDVGRIATGLQGAFSKGKSAVSGFGSTVSSYFTNRIPVFTRQGLAKIPGQVKGIFGKAASGGVSAFGSKLVGMIPTPMTRMAGLIGTKLGGLKGMFKGAGGDGVGALGKGLMGGMPGMLSTIGGALKTGLVAAVKAAAVAAAAIGTGILATINMASDREQAAGGVEAIYGEDAKVVQDAAKKAAKDYGISEQAWLQSAIPMGSILSGSGIDNAGGMSNDLLARAADLSALTGKPMQEAIEGVNAVLRGEYDSIDQFGVSMKQSDVTDRLKAQGKDKLEGEAYNQAEMQARYDLLMERSSKAEGTFSKESGSFSGLKTSIGAQFQDIGAEIGDIFKPEAERVLRWVNDTFLPYIRDVFVPWLRDDFMPWWKREVEPKLAWLWTKLTEIWNRLKNVGTEFQDFRDKFGQTDLGQGLTTAYNTWIKPVFDGINAWAKDPETQEQFRRLWSTIETIFRTAFQIIGTIIGTAVSIFKGIWDFFGLDMESLTRGFLQIVTSVFEIGLSTISGVLQMAKGILTGDWEAVGAGWSAITQGWVDGISGIFGGIVTAFEGPINKVIDVINSFGDKYNEFRKNLQLTSFLPEFKTIGPVRSAATKQANAEAAYKSTAVNIQSNYSKIQSSQGQAAADQFLASGKARLAAIKASAYANGGIHNPVSRDPQIQSQPILWAEAGREAYIPLDRSKRTRSLSLWQQVGRELGALPMANGGVFPLPAGTYRQTQGVHGVDRGYDYGAPIGTPVMANADASVVASKDLGNRSYGKYVKLSNGSIYAHLSQLIARVGQIVKAGQLIGRVGSTGRSSGPHLHYVPAGPLGAITGGSGFGLFDGMFQSAFDALIPGAPGDGIGKGLWGMLPKIAGAMVSKLKDKATSFLGFDSASISGGSSQWDSVILQALSHVGQPASLLDVVRRRLMQESSGNQFAINNWDINAKNGTPSKGLMQVIAPTFASHRDKSLPNDIYNPLANIVASMNYAKSRYGSLAAAFNRPGGYDSGGWLMPGLTMSLNKTGKPEAILTDEQWQDISAVATMASRSESSSGSTSITVNGVKYDSAEDVAKEIEKAQKKAAVRRRYASV